MNKPYICRCIIQGAEDWKRLGHDWGDLAELPQERIQELFMFVLSPFHTDVDGVRVCHNKSEEDSKRLKEEFKKNCDESYKKYRNDQS